jgi:hypothetical protein
MYAENFREYANLEHDIVDIRYYKLWSNGHHFSLGNDIVLSSSPGTVPL